MITNDTKSKYNNKNSAKFTQKDKEIIVQIALQDRKLNSKQIAVMFSNKYHKNISCTSVTNILANNGLMRCRKVNVQFLTENHKKKRIEWCLDKKDVSIDYWHKVLFSDESMFRETQLGVEYVTRTSEEKFLEEFVQMKKQSGGMHWMVWGAFDWYGYRPLYFEKPKEHMTAVSYINILKKEDILGYCFAHNHTFQQDNAPIHTAKITKQYITKNNVKILIWPARSPDINPIENLWSIVKYRLKGRIFDNIWQFQNAIKEVWESIDIRIFQNLINSMPKRIQDCIDANGAWIDY